MENKPVRPGPGRFGGLEVDAFGQKLPRRIIRQIRAAQAEAAAIDRLIRTVAHLERLAKRTRRPTPPTSKETQ